MAKKNIVMMNRAPVLTLWGTVVAERMGFDEDTALTLAKVMAGLNAQSKGRMIGIFSEPKAPERGGMPKKVGLGEDFWVRLCGRAVPAKNTENGVRGVVKDQEVDPDKVRTYLKSKFQDDLDRVCDAMTELAGAFEPDELEDVAFDLYAEFRPEIERGKAGWGQKGELDLDRIRSLAKRD